MHGRSLTQETNTSAHARTPWNTMEFLIQLGFFYLANTQRYLVMAAHRTDLEMNEDARGHFVKETLFQCAVVKWLMTSRSLETSHASKSLRPWMHRLARRAGNCGQNCTVCSTLCAMPRVQGGIPELGDLLKKKRPLANQAALQALCMFYLYALDR